MSSRPLDDETRRRVLQAQHNEITEHHIYQNLASMVPDEENRDILQRISDDELRHYRFWKQHTGEELRPDRFKIALYTFIGRTMGVTFAAKLMEAGEGDAQEEYTDLTPEVPGAADIADDEDDHEDALLKMIDEERLQYVGSMVLGLNDALVELTGALAGFTFAMRNTQLIAMAGLITGIAAALSMAASEYLSTKSEATDQHPVKAAMYTGVAYIGAVFFLILPFLLLGNVYEAMGLTLAAAIVIIFIFSFYIAIAKGVSFRERFVEMAVLSFGVAALSFGIGIVVRQFFDIDV